MPDYTPDRRIVPLKVTITAGTAQAAPASTALDLSNTILHRVGLLIPRGHNGFTGIQVAYDGVGIVPWGVPPTFLIGDDETLDFEVGMVQGHAATVRGFNTGRFDHAFYFRFEVEDVGLMLERRNPGAPAQLVLA